MSSFFKSADKIQVGQTEVSIPAENGLNYQAGGRIDMYIPPTSKFIDLSQTKLKMNVSLAIPTVTDANGATRVQLDAETGLHSLIRSVRIFSGRKTALLEEIEGYDILTALRFDYETNENFRGKRALTEGATNYDPACRGTLGSLKSQQANCISNPYFTKVPTVNPTLSTSFTANSDYDFHVATGELHLNTGLFRNEAVFPALLTDGIFIEILLQDSRRVFRTLDTVNRNRHLSLCPVFHSTNGSDGQSDDSGSWQNGSAISSFFTTRDNNQTSTQVCPFVVGEKITFACGKAGSISASTNASIGRITQIEQVTGDTVGNSKTKYTLAANVSNTTGETLGDTTARYHVVSANLEGNANITNYTPTYTVSDVELIVKQIEVPQGYEASMMGMMKEGGTINYDYRSFTNYRYSQLQSDNVANIRLPLIESRATAILCVPTDATTYSSIRSMSASDTYIEYDDSLDFRTRSSRNGLVGICDELTDYQFIYDGRINPSRRVDTSKIASKTSISQQWCIEAEKALAMSDIEPLSFMKFRSNFFIGRALALGKNSVYDTRGKDFNLQVEYTGTAQTKPKLWNNYVSHIRRLEIKNGGLSVMR
tara:strand:- start:6784 stop:8571 length:1788 start_codon:yes stop_codon:yes gene_type:complete